MNALQRFEDWVSSTLEDRLGALLGGRVEPADLARRLAQAMDDNRSVGAGRLYGPNLYRIYLAPWTFAAFAGYQQALQDELASFISQSARESGLHLVGRPRVQLLVDPELRPESMRVEADLAEPLGEASGQTRAIDLGPVLSREERSLELVVAGRAPVELKGDRISIGRALTNDLVLDEPSVSRRHARLVRRGHHWLVEDEGSTHGSFVNGHRVTSCLLRVGDEIRFGSAVATVQPSEAIA